MSSPRSRRHIYFFDAGGKLLVDLRDSLGGECRLDDDGVLRGLVADDAVPVSELLAAGVDAPIDAVSLAAQKRIRRHAKAEATKTLEGYRDTGRESFVTALQESPEPAEADDLGRLPEAIEQFSVDDRFRAPILWTSEGLWRTSVRARVWPGGSDANPTALLLVLQGDDPGKYATAPAARLVRIEHVGSGP